MSPITAEEQLSKNNKLKKENIEYLRDWMSKQPHLPSGVTDEQLILFLNCCKHSLEACKQTIEMYYTIRTHAPELFANRDTRRRELQQALSIIEIVAMPKRDQHGNLVMAGRVVDNNVSKFSYEETTKAWFMLQDVILLEEGAIPGFVFVLDASSAGMGHLARTSLSTVKKYYMYIQEAFPGIVIANHMVNAGPVIEAFINIGKPFMNKELASKIFIHSSFDTLHEHVTKDALPKEFGGNLDSLSSYSKITMAQLEKYRDWFKEEEG
ncbi:alpha-tocopherol transfer protein-like isoform X2 [Zootermopsis nevadensis]|uniref:alpha-tocopherol transfer protein-like isoform X2 n=1 Tax=Zootermopsis nevadensis TaxID=136037 RepID=UPI000B8E7C34|nr:alpha-tocopherol transfer protein-like isoform X2 [Zootermopsis nevadensis]